VEKGKLKEKEARVLDYIVNNSSRYGFHHHIAHREEIQKYCNCSRMAVFRAIASLITKGYLEENSKLHGYYSIMENYNKFNFPENHYIRMKGVGPFKGSALLQYYYEKLIMDEDIKPSDALTQFEVLTEDNIWINLKDFMETRNV
jgi:hypothetical protein